MRIFAKNNTIKKSEKALKNKDKHINSMKKYDEKMNYPGIFLSLIL